MREGKELLTPCAIGKIAPSPFMLEAKETWNLAIDAAALAVKQYEKTRFDAIDDPRLSKQPESPLVELVLGLKHD